MAITDNVIVHYPEQDAGYAAIQVDAVTEVSQSCDVASQCSASPTAHDPVAIALKAVTCVSSAAP